MRHRNARYIILDGIDRCGKGTQLLTLANGIYRRSKKYDHVLLTREPTDGQWGIAVRNLLTRDRDPLQHAEECVKYFFADRIEHTQRVICHALSYGWIVLQDRGKYSTVAYQHAQGVDLIKLVDMHEVDNWLRDARPDLVVVLDITPEEAIRRSETSTEKREKFEQPEFLEKVRKTFLQMPELFPQERIEIVDGMRPLEEVAKDLEDRVGRLLPF